MEKRKINILVVDDEPDFRKLMTFWLVSKGYSVIEAAEGESAIRIVKEQPPSIVFMDLRMPKMDGVETIKKIREFNNEIPVIIITAFINDQKAKEAMPLGISGVFFKGSDFEEEFPLLESVLRTHKKLAE
jgi:CheY-like chemotaxis protein